MSAGLDASTATPGSTPPLESLTRPVMALCADAAAGRNTPTSDTARIAAKRTLRRIRTSRGERVATWLDVSPGMWSVNGIVRVVRHVSASCPNSWIRLQFLAPGDGRNHEDTKKLEDHEEKNSLYKKFFFVVFVSSWFPRALRYSYLSAWTGFTRDARRAGRYAARNVTASTIGMTMSSAAGSRSSLPDGNAARSSCPAPTLAARPTINPTSASTSPCRRIIRRTMARSA